MLVSNSAGTVLSSEAVLTVSLGPPCAAPPAGLVSWWQGEGDAADATGGNSGTLLGNAACGAGRVGQGFVLDGNLDGVNVGSGTNLWLQDFSIEAWVKRASASVVSYDGNGNGQILSVGSWGGFGFFLPDLSPGPHRLTVTFVAKDGGTTSIERTMSLAGIGWVLEPMKNESSAPRRSFSG